MADLCTATPAVRLMLHYPFWAEVFYSMKVIEDYSVKTLQTDGVRLWVNPDYFNPLTLEYRITALAHELCHKILFHCTRGLEFDPYWGNVAADIVVNTLLHKNGFKIHPAWVQPEPKYDGWTFEAVYHDLMRNMKKPPPQPQGGQGQPKPGDEQGGGKGQASEGDKKGGKGKGSKGKDKPEAGEGGNGKDTPAPTPDDKPGTFAPGTPEQWKDIQRDVQKFKGSQEARDKLEQKIEVDVTNALARAKGMGKAPAGIQGAMDALKEVKKEAWFDHVARFMQALCMSEFNWARTERRYFAMHDVFTPDVYSPVLEKVVILTDASGSCFEAAQQANFGGHMSNILSETKPRKVIVMTFDTKVHHTYEIDPNNFEMERPRGGGGTSFVEPLQRADEEQPSVIIVLTDMMGTFPTEAPSCPVLWASTIPNIEPPFGDIVYIN
jgi:predicted metal-dependent peptidase